MLCPAKKKFSLYYNTSYNFFPPVALWPNAAHGLLILEVSNHTQRHITVGRTPLDD